MTRKDELAERATRFLKENGQYDENGDIYLCDVEELLGMLLQVEREVWSRVIDHLEPCCGLVVRPGVKDGIMCCKESDWARAQQQELT